jgi:hypothetical protein
VRYAYNCGVGFYYGPDTPPPEKERFAGLKEVWAVTIAVFSVLAVPLGLLFGGIGWLVLTFYLFSIHWSLGLLSLLLLALAVAAFAYYDRHRPTKIEV